MLDSDSSLWCVTISTPTEAVRYFGSVAVQMDKSTSNFLLSSCHFAKYLSGSGCEKSVMRWFSPSVVKITVYGFSSSRLAINAAAIFSIAVLNAPIDSSLLIDFEYTLDHPRTFLRVSLIVTRRPALGIPLAVVLAGLVIWFVSLK
jgi:hypothetical protein